MTTQTTDAPSSEAWGRRLRERLREVRRADSAERAAAWEAAVAEATIRRAGGEAAGHAAFAAFARQRLAAAAASVRALVAAKPAGCEATEADKRALFALVEDEVAAALAAVEAAVGLGLASAALGEDAAGDLLLELVVDLCDRAVDYPAEYVPGNGRPAAADAGGTVGLAQRGVLERLLLFGAAERERPGEEEEEEEAAAADSARRPPGRHRRVAEWRLRTVAALLSTDEDDASSRKTGSAAERTLQRIAETHPGWAERVPPELLDRLGVRRGAAEAALARAGAAGRPVLSDAMHHLAAWYGTVGRPDAAPPEALPADLARKVRAALAGHLAPTVAVLRCLCRAKPVVLDALLATFLRADAADAATVAALEAVAEEPFGDGRGHVAEAEADAVARGEVGAVDTGIDQALAWAGPPAALLAALDRRPLRFGPCGLPDALRRRCGHAALTDGRLCRVWPAALPALEDLWAALRWVPPALVGRAAWDLGRWAHLLVVELGETAPEDAAKCGDIFLRGLEEAAVLAGRSEAQLLRLALLLTAGGLGRARPFGALWEGREAEARRIAALLGPVAATPAGAAALAALAAHD